MAQFYPLRVAEIRRDTRDAVILTLEPRDEDRAAFAFIQGQYLTFRRRFDGQELRRSYSICAGVDEGRLRVGVKKVQGGWFSSFANEELKVGDTLEAMSPMGNFHTPLVPDAARSYLGFAGGSGVTPMISQAKTILAREPRSTFALIYANRSSASVMFREELEDIKNTYMERFSVLHILETETEIELFSGVLTKEKCDTLLDRWVDADDVDAAFICGPEPMMLAVAEALKERGVEKSKIKFELFASPALAKSSRPAPGAAENDARATCEASIVLDGARVAVAMPKNGQSILEAALSADLDAPFACKGGVCSTCRAKVLQGEVMMEKNYALEDYEVENGYVLTCQCFPLSDVVVIDYDQ